MLRGGIPAQLSSDASSEMQSAKTQASADNKKPVTMWRGGAGAQINPHLPLNGAVNVQYTTVNGVWL